ncbi:MAG TPA: hypothetical protein PKV72_06025, partial [Candidatus Peribacteria bacterium]|nr:hypothetical protein [Candidatus Peribacteria bacterium]
KTLVVSGNASVTGSLVVNKNISGATLEILGTASGANLYATRSITGTNIYAATTFGGAGLASCSNSTTSKLLYNSATKQFSCGTDQTGGTGVAGTSSFSGAVLTLGDARYVKKSGDTMTGSLVINITGGNANTLGLKVLNTFSGAIIHAEKTLTASGMLITESGALIDAGTLYVDAGNNRVGIGTTAPTAILSVASPGGAVTMNNPTAGNGVILAGSGGGVGGQLRIVSNGGGWADNKPTAYFQMRTARADNSLYNNNVTFMGGTYGADTVMDRLQFDASFTSVTDTAYGSTPVPTSLFELINSTASKNLLKLKAAASQTANLTEWQNSAGLVLASVDKTGSGFLAALGVGTNSPKAKLDVAGTISGKTLVISGNGSFSGALVVKKSISGAALEILGTASGQNLFATRSVTGSYLYAGVTFGGAGLVSCSNGTSSKLLYNSATKQFSCGTDQSGSSGISMSVADERYVKKQGDTMTGSLIITNNGTIAIGGVSAQAYNILSDSSTATHTSDIASDNDLFIEGAFEVDGPAYLDNGLTVSSTASFNSGITVSSAGTFNSVIAVGGISAQSYNAFSDSGGASHTGDVTSDDDVFIAGSMEVDGNVYFDGELIGTTVSGMGLTSCTGSSNKLTYNSASKQFGCETDQTGGGSFTNFTISDGGSTSTIDNADTLTFNDGTDINLTVSGDSVTASFTNASGYLSSATADTNYVNVSGDTMNGTLILSSGTPLQLSSGGYNNCDHLTTDSSGYIGCGSSSSSSSTWTDGGTYLYPTNNESINVGGVTGYTYNIFSNSATTSHGLSSISDVMVAGNFEVDGTVYFDGELVGTTLSGFGLTDCDASNSKLLWDSTTKTFSCGTDQTGGSGAPEVGTSSFSGAVLLLGDARYVKKQGDTMTGAL